MPDADQFFLGQLQTEIANLNKARVKFEGVAEQTTIFMTKTTERLRAGAEKFKAHEDKLIEHDEQIQELSDTPKAKTVVALIVGGFTFIGLLITLFGFLITNGVDKQATKNYNQYSGERHENP